MKKIFIIAGEVSGDIHGANLVSSVLKKSGDVEFFGLGGARMQGAGVKLYYNLVDVSVLGLFEVVKKYSLFKRIFAEAVARLDAERFDCVILIDYPGFNMRFAREVKKRGIGLIYYISPQVWAWGRKRIGTIKKLVDRLIVLFKFEEEMYRKSGLEVQCVGHPLLDLVRPSITKEESYRAFNLEEGKKTIALFPGSREFEVKALLPVMLKTAELIKMACPEVQFLIARVESLKEEVFSSVTEKAGLDIKIVAGRTYDVIEAADLVIVKSGTGTLETAILEKPMIITYKASLITYLLTRMLIKLPYIGLVNVIAGRKVAPEFLQFDARADLMAEEAVSLLKDTGKIERMKESLRAIKEKLGEGGANEKAAEVVLRFLATI